MNAQDLASGSATGMLPELDELSASAQPADPAALSALFDLDLEVSVVLGRTTLTVQDVLELGRGSVVQLDRQVGEPVDIYVGQRRLAEGEVVVLDDTFGVRITRIIAQGNGNPGNGSAAAGSGAGASGSGA
jgi:flagellar motor switch protein FliN